MILKRLCDNSHEDFFFFGYLLYELDQKSLKWGKGLLDYTFLFLYFLIKEFDSNVISDY